MYLFDFISKIKQLNPRLYVRSDQKTSINEDWSVVGLYLREGGGSKQSVSSSVLTGAKSPKSRYLCEIYHGAKDKFIIGIPHNWVPEYSIFDLEKGETLARGWRSILVGLLKLQLIDRKSTQKIFNCASLGNSDYDHLSAGEKLRQAREL